MDNTDNRRFLIVTLTEIVDGIRVEWVEDRGQFIFPGAVYNQCSHVIYGTEWIVHVDVNMVADYMSHRDCIRVVSKLWMAGLFSELGEVEIDE